MKWNPATNRISQIIRNLDPAHSSNPKAKYSYKIREASPKIWGGFRNHPRSYPVKNHSLNTVWTPVFHTPIAKAILWKANNNFRIPTTKCLGFRKSWNWRCTNLNPNVIGREEILIFSPVSIPLWILQSLKISLISRKPL